MSNHQTAFKQIQLPADFIWDFNLETHPEETDFLYKKAWQRYFLEPAEDANQEKQNANTAPAQYSFYFWGIRHHGALVAAISLVSLPLEDKKIEALPDDGWEWACLQCMQNGQHNGLSLLSAAVDPKYQNYGFSKTLLNQAKENALALGIRTIIAPVRPSQKDKFPQMLISDYLQKKNENGEIFDPWLRTHLKLGARMLNVCNRSVVIKASLKKWREWTGLEIKQSDESFLPIQALNPVKIQEDRGIYIEPNIWVIYDL